MRQRIRVAGSRMLLRLLHLPSPIPTHSPPHTHSSRTLTLFHPPPPLSPTFSPTHPRPTEHHHQPTRRPKPSNNSSRAGYGAPGLSVKRAKHKMSPFMHFSSYVITCCHHSRSFLLSRAGIKRLKNKVPASICNGNKTMRGRARN